MRIGVLGVNHKLAELQLREQLALSCQRRFGSYHIALQNLQCILLSTCNRTEIYFFANEDVAAAHSYILKILRHDVEGDFDQKLYSYFGSDCFWHLCRVTAGLDSALIGETEIQGQVKNAYRSAQEFTSLPHELHYLFQKSLAIGKKVRTALPTSPLLTQFEEKIFAAIQRHTPHNKPLQILFVGASEINHKLIDAFKQKGIDELTLCNRSNEAAMQLATDYQIAILEWPFLATMWHRFDIVIVATKAPYYLLKPPHCTASAKLPRLIIDLAVPRNVDPLIASLHPSLALYNIDQIHNGCTIETTGGGAPWHSAEALITESVQLHLELFRRKELYKHTFNDGDTVAPPHGQYAFSS